MPGNVIPVFSRDQKSKQSNWGRNTDQNSKQHQVSRKPTHRGCWVLVPHLEKQRAELEKRGAEYHGQLKTLCTQWYRNDWTDEDSSLNWHNCAACSWSPVLPRKAELPLSTQRLGAWAKWPDGSSPQSRGDAPSEERQMKWETLLPEDAERDEGSQHSRVNERKFYHSPLPDKYAHLSNLGNAWVVTGGMRDSSPGRHLLLSLGAIPHNFPEACEGGKSCGTMPVKGKIMHPIKDRAERCHRSL